LLVGAQKMQRELGVSASLITAINGTLVIFVVSSQLFIRRRAKRRVSGGPPVSEIEDVHEEIYSEEPSPLKAEMKST
jgi:ABC-type uncharacterized transport system permease subunit